jgi:hypothetical protein
MGDEQDGIRTDTGLPPALVGAAVYQGVPIVMRSAFNSIPHGLAMLTMSGEPIRESYGTPLGDLAGFTRHEVHAIQDFAKQQGVTMPIVAGAAGGEGGEMIDKLGPLRKLLARISGDVAEEDVIPHIALSTSSVPHALHEIGHASSIAGSDQLRRVFQGLGKTLGQSSAIGSILRAALAGSVLAPPNEDSSKTRQFVYDHAPELVGATMVPELLEEGRASVKALQGAASHGPGVAKTLLELAPAFGTYAAAAAAPVFATVLARRIVAALEARRQNEAKTAAAEQGNEVKAPGALRADASSAWQIGMNPPKPKTIGPTSRIGTNPGGSATAKPPSKTSYFKDQLDSLNSPQRGSRLATTV